MKRNTSRLSALTLTATALLGACTLISEVDRSKIADETPDPSGMGGDPGDGDMGDGDGDMGDGDGDMGDGDMGGGGGEGGAGGAGGASN